MRRCQKTPCYFTCAASKHAYVVCTLLQTALAHEAGGETLPAMTREGGRVTHDGDGLGDWVDLQTQSFTIMYQTCAVELILTVRYSSNRFIWTSLERYFMHCLSDIMRRKPSLKVFGGATSRPRPVSSCIVHVHARSFDTVCQSQYSSVQITFEVWMGRKGSPYPP